MRLGYAISGRRSPLRSIHSEASLMSANQARPSGVVGSGWGTWLSAWRGLGPFYTRPGHLGRPVLAPLTVDQTPVIYNRGTPQGRRPSSSESPEPHNHAVSRACRMKKTRTAAGALDSPRIQTAAAATHRRASPEAVDAATSAATGRQPSPDTAQGRAARDTAGTRARAPSRRRNPRGFLQSEESQARALRLIAASKEERGISPTLAELCKGMEATSKSSVLALVAFLNGRGLISHVPGAHRTYTVTEKGFAVLAASSKPAGGAS